MSWSTYSSASGYLKLTFLNSTTPFSFSSPCVRSPSTILDLVSMTSMIRFADTLALGMTTKSMHSTRKLMSTCMEYCENTAIVE